MQPERYQKLKDLFGRAMDLDTVKRREFVDAVDDREIRTELLRLLADDKSGDERLDVSPVKSFIGGQSFVGEKVGHYEILSELGRGGMGAVYLAERDDLKGKKVALKIIRRELTEPALLERFKTERNILAQLEHHNIAALYDSGTTTDGLPYFAMEYVEGSSIIDYVNQNRLDVKDRLELFRKVCSAIQYAHSRLVVHRDLKPSNILVGADSEPKLLDFGIAKIITDEINTSPGTATSMGMMTPVYASPEQIRGETVGTSTDVYSLGVILFEVLTGGLPYDVGGKRIDEIVHAVCETDPKRPSSVVLESGNTTNATANELSRETGGDKIKLQNTPTNARLLKGDLDNILLKALKKEPERRYSTVEQFSEDIRRHLEGLPVTARPDTFGYRASKFVKRNRAAVASGGLIAAALIAGLVGTGWQTVRAERERAVAEKRFADVREIANNVVFKYYDEVQKLQGSTAVSKMMLSDAVNYLDKLSADASDNVDLSRELARAYLKIGGLQGGIHGTVGTGETAEAGESIKKAIALLESAAKNSKDPEILRELRTAYADYGMLLNRTGNEETAAYLQKAVDISQRLFDEKPDDNQRRIELATDLMYLADSTPDPDAAIINKGDVYFGSEEKYLASHKLFVEALAIEPESRRALERKTAVDSRLSGIYQLSADAYRKRGDEAKKAEFAAKAIEYIDYALESADKVTKIDPDDFSWRSNLTALNWNKSLIFALVDRYDEALKTQTAEIAKKEKEVEADKSDVDGRHSLGVMYDGAAATYSYMNDHANAKLFQQKGLKIADELISIDPSNHEYRQTRRDIANNLAATAGNEGNIDEAVAMYRRAFEAYKSSPGLAEKPDELAYMNGLMHEKIGDLYKKDERFKLAVGEYDQALKLWSQPEVAKNYLGGKTEQTDAVRQKLDECRGKTS